MRKKDYSEELQEIVDNTKYVKVKIEDEIHKSFMSYAMMVNMSHPSRHQTPHGHPTATAGPLPAEQKAPAWCG